MSCSEKQGGGVSYSYPGPGDASNSVQLYILSTTVPHVDWRQDTGDNSRVEELIGRVESTRYSMASSDLGIEPGTEYVLTWKQRNRGHDSCVV